MPGAVREAGGSGHWEEPAPARERNARRESAAAGEPGRPEKDGEAAACSGASLSLPPQHTYRQVYRGRAPAMSSPWRQERSEGRHDTEKPLAFHSSRGPPDSPGPQIRLSLPLEQIHFESTPPPPPRKPPRQPLSHSFLQELLAPREVAGGAGNSMGDTRRMAPPHLL